VGLGALNSTSAHAHAAFSNFLEPFYDFGVRQAGFRRQILEAEGYEVSMLLGHGRGGPDLVLLHGLGDRGSTWALLLRRLSRGPWGRIIVPDMPGFGYSLLPREELADLNVNDGVQFLTTLIDVMCEDGAFVVGNSLGGWIAWRSLHLQPKQVLGALLLAPAGFMSPEELAEVGQLFTAPDAKQFARACLPDASMVIRQAAVRVMAPVLESEVVQSFARADSRGYLLEPGELEGLEHRLRVLWGSQDGIIPQSCLSRLKEALGERVVVEPLGHAPQRTRPGVVLRELMCLREQALP